MIPRVPKLGTGVTADQHHHINKAEIVCNLGDAGRDCVIFLKKYAPITGTVLMLPSEWL